ncbi:hypothetical protein HU200_054682 [Digitaria exilis]|uniref:TIR domain-containing protein n=1 Tax=Digitaria exilis TaxID=1010633 RepID=A0A835AKJ8_9POAL|nr:hypothetical protein HU200_054682 [Digitaria exilis]
MLGEGRESTSAPSRREAAPTNKFESLIFRQSLLAGARRPAHNTAGCCCYRAPLLSAYQQRKRPTDRSIDRAFRSSPHQQVQSRLARIPRRSMASCSCGHQQQQMRSMASGPSAIASRLNAVAAAVAGDAAAATWWATRRLVDDENDSKAATPTRPSSATYDVFINHRGVDTKHNVARLLYDRIEHLSGGKVRSFLDNKSMRPGDRLGESIDEGIRQCKVAVAIFSKRYFDSEFCLHELASIVESRKVLIPIFYGIKPSELILPKAVEDSQTHAPRDIERFRLALQEAKYTVGLTYDPATGYLRTPLFLHAPLKFFDRRSSLSLSDLDLAELVYTAADAVMERIQEMGQRLPQRQMIASRL